jgi:hypothetical protein
MGVASVLGGMAASPGAWARQVTLDLASLPTGTFSSLSVDGFNLNWVGFGDQQTITDINGTYALQDSDQQNASGAEINITRADGGIFSLACLDWAALNGDYGNRVEVDGVDYTELPGSLTTVGNLANTTNITDLDIDSVDEGSDYAIANLVFDVPEPASLAALGMGVLTIATMRRRRAV